MTREQKDILLEKTEKFVETVEEVLYGKEFNDFDFELTRFIVNFCFDRMEDIPVIKK